MSYRFPFISMLKCLIRSFAIYNFVDWAVVSLPAVIAPAVYVYNLPMLFPVLPAFWHTTWVNLTWLKHKNWPISNVLVTPLLFLFYLYTVFYFILVFVYGTKVNYRSYSSPVTYHLPLIYYSETLSKVFFLSKTPYIEKTHILKYV